MAKAPHENGSDSEGRKLGEQNGLDTRNPAVLKNAFTFFELLKTFGFHEISGISIVNLLVILLFTSQDQKHENLLANYPSSPSRKRCELGVAHSSGMCSVEAKVLSSPPGKYGRKAET